jgi:hypothetical protein
MRCWTGDFDEDPVAVGEVDWLDDEPWWEVDVPVAAISALSVLVLWPGAALSWAVVSPPEEAGVSDDGPAAVVSDELPASFCFAAADLDTEGDAIEMTLGPSLEPLAIEL